MIDRSKEKLGETNFIYGMTTEHESGCVNVNTTPQISIEYYVALTKFSERESILFCFFLLLRFDLPLVFFLCSWQTRRHWCTTSTYKFICVYSRYRFDVADARILNLSWFRMHKMIHWVCVICWFVFFSLFFSLAVVAKGNAQNGPTKPYHPNQYSKHTKTKPNARECTCMLISLHDKYQSYFIISNQYEIKTRIKLHDKTHAPIPLQNFNERR